jgi:hypothetical protein
MLESLRSQSVFIACSLKPFSRLKIGTVCSPKLWYLPTNPHGVTTQKNKTDNIETDLVETVVRVAAGWKWLRIVSKAER